MFDIKRVNHKLVAGLPTMMHRVTRYVPGSVQGKMLECSLNRFFHSELKQNELAFMGNKQVVVAVSDIGLQFGIRLNRNRLQIELNPTQQDLLLKAEFADFIAMISNQVDPDTLFFRRRLRGVPICLLQKQLCHRWLRGPRLHPTRRHPQPPPGRFQRPRHLCGGDR